MPGLVVFNRRWMFASDDLVIPFGIAVVLRTAWLLIVVITFGIHIGDNSHHSDYDGDCKYTRTHIYFIVYIIILILSSINDVCVVYVSSRGTIYDEKEERRHIPKLLYVRTVILTFEAICGIAGSFTSFSKQAICDSHDVVLAKCIVIFNFIWVFGSLVYIYIAFDSTGKLRFKMNLRKKQYGSMEILEYQNKIARKSKGYWEKTCRFLFCCTKTETDKDNVLLFASKIFSEFFCKYEDLVPSDLLAGMILLRQKQKYEESKRVEAELKDTNASYQQVTVHRTHRSVRRHQKTPNSVPFNMEDQDEIKILEDITYFAKYALACYGWPMYCLLNNFPLCTSPGRKLLSRVRCCHCCRGFPDHYPTIQGDNCCLCNYATQKAYLNTSNDAFIYVCYSDEVFQTPFSVMVDHSRDAIVISCRGTLSLEDVLTDLAIEEKAIPGGEEDWTAHEGFLQSASAIKEILEEKQLIKKAQNFDVNKGSQDYKIIVVGHSLGAGTASLLAFLLRPKYPAIKCYAYGPSGSAVSYKASLHARDFIYSVVLGKDIIGRLNMNTMNELQHNILQMLKKTKLPKWRILHGCMCRCLLCCTRSSNHSYEEYFRSEEEIMNFEPHQSPTQEKLYMAGKVVHICKIKSIYPRFGRKKAAYQAYWSTPEDFQNILISNLMLHDHFPDTLINALSSILPADIEMNIPVFFNTDDTSLSIVLPELSVDREEEMDENCLFVDPESPTIF